MDRVERTEATMQELFHQPAVTTEGTDPEFMRILQRFIFGDVCHTGSLDNRMRELVTVTVLATLNTLPQLKAHTQAALNVGCTPIEIREAIYQCAPFIGFPKTLNAIDAILDKVKGMYAGESITDIDGVKIDFEDKWVHLRKSNTEPIIRVYSEAHTMDEADRLGKEIMQVVYDMQK